MTDFCYACKALFRDGSEELDYRVVAAFFPTGFPPDRSYKGFRLHHVNVWELQDGAVWGCPLCRAVWQSLTDKEQEEVLPLSKRSLETSTISLENAFPVIYFCLSIAISFYLPKANIEAGGPQPFVVTNICVQEGKYQLPKPFHTYKPSINTGGKETIELINKWITNCTKNHELCNSEPSLIRQLPSRLIDVQNRIHLCASSDLSVEIEYITLSHRWGSQKFLTLTRQNLSDWMVELPLQELPSTFQDAISFAKASGIGYIWIDSLCIVQDCEEDWRNESKLMAVVYANSWCNLAADAAADSDSGLFVNRDVSHAQPNNVQMLRWVSPGDVGSRRVGTQSSQGPRTLDDVPLENVEEGLVDYTLVSQALWWKNVLHTSLAHRAWVVQERLLAKRVVHFTRTQVFFECRHSQVCEAYPRGFPICINVGYATNSSRRTDDQDVKSSFADHYGEVDIDPDRQFYAALKTWSKIISLYTQCGLSVETDRIIALSGIATVMKRSFNCRYLAGLWDDHLDRQLTWKNSSTADSAPLSRPKAYIAPSWSWASLNGPVSLGDEGPFIKLPWIPVRKIPIRILEAEIETVDGTEMSSAVAGYLKVAGQLTPVEGSSMLKRTGQRTWTRNQCVREVGGAGTRFIPNEDGGVGYYDLDFDGEELQTVCYCLPTICRGRASYFSGILLKPVGMAKGVFRRVGVFGDKIDKNYYNGLEGDQKWRHIDERLYEEYDAVTKEYTFKII
ncbi:HET domain containing protein [Hyaloscypha variabilis]